MKTQLQMTNTYLLPKKISYMIQHLTCLKDTISHMISLHEQKSKV